MELTKVQRKILEVLIAENKEITDRELSTKYGINTSDIVREGALFKDQGFAEFEEKNYIEIDYLPIFKEYKDNSLPEFRLLQALEQETVITLGGLESIIKRHEIGPAINELRRLNLISVEKGEDDKLAFITYTLNEGKKVIEERNATLEIIRTKNSFLIDSDELRNNYENLKELERRKLIKLKEKSEYNLKILEKGMEILKKNNEKITTILTPEMIMSGDWKECKFKEYDPSVESKKITAGRLHPLRQLALYVERIFRDMGYEFMVGGLVVDSFHNFDALFTPQDHPAREMQDTFFLEHPQLCDELPEELAEKVKVTHENSFKYDWDYKVARRNIMRTHTTAITAQYLAEKRKPPFKLFSIGRVFRNEKIDAMHLPEFHQIEGVVVGNVNLRDLMGHISAFYERIGLKDLTFKKTFNPYTEPSMEIYAYHPALGKHIEVGNSGMFRPEMMKQFGYENERAIAWGLALERLASIVYQKPKIKDLYGTEVDIDWLRGETKLWL